MTLLLAAAGYIREPLPVASQVRQVVFGLILCVASSEAPRYWSAVWSPTELVANILHSISAYRYSSWHRTVDDVASLQLRVMRNIVYLPASINQHGGCKYLWGGTTAQNIAKSWNCGRWQIFEMYADFILVTFRKIETNISTARTRLVYLAFVVTNIKLLCNKYVDCSLLY